MTTRQEAAWQALWDAIEASRPADAKFVAEGAKPQLIPYDGLLSMGLGFPTLTGEVMSATLTKEWRLDIPIEILVQNPAGSERGNLFQTLAERVGAAVEADVTLGGVVDYADVGSIEDGAEIPIDGENIRAGTITVSIYYMTGTNPLEAI